MRPIFFTPGPSELYFTVPDHLKAATRSGLMSFNHRSSEFTSVVKDTLDHLRIIFNLAEQHRIVFTYSATEIWERLVLNLAASRTAFVVNGSFSRRFSETSDLWGRQTEVLDIEDGLGLEPGIAPFSSEPELIGITLNETSTGVSHPLETLYSLREQYPDSILAVDIVSSAPVHELDFSKIDTAYFSVQKGFGLPAGLGVWIFNEKCLRKAHKMEADGLHTGSYHRLTKLAEQIDQFQTPSTPNMLAIYLLGKVAEDMLSKGMDMIRRESRYKAALLYQIMEDHSYLQPFVTEKKFRSQTTLVGSVENSRKWIDELSRHNMIVGQGYGAHRDSHIRIANFPTHSKEQIELLADRIVKIV